MNKNYKFIFLIIISLAGCSSPAIKSHLARKPQLTKTIKWSPFTDQFSERKESLTLYKFTPKEISDLMAFCEKSSYPIGCKYNIKNYKKNRITPMEIAQDECIDKNGLTSYEAPIVYTTFMLNDITSCLDRLSFYLPSYKTSLSPIIQSCIEFQFKAGSSLEAVQDYYYDDTNLNKDLIKEAIDKCFKPIAKNN